jgi:filamentous hemagglutinin family protein
MNIHQADTARRSHRSLHAALLASVSALTLLAAAEPAPAAPVLARQSSPVSIAAAQATASAEQAAAMAQQSMASLARATQALQAMQAAQSAARSLALSAPSAVPDGLASGGLVPDSGLASTGVANPISTWVGANTPIQTTSNGQTLVTIQQTGQQALLNWNSFNVGKNTTVDFNQQGNASWIALNKINDPSGVPSQILGSIKADGQVLLINANGIIFGGSSQVNVHTLIASALDLGSSVSANNYQLFLQNGLFQSPLSSIFGFSGSGTGAAIFQGSSNSGTVTVQPGAVIDTTGTLSPTGDGGYVALLGTGVSNAGTITAQNGQIILAADTTIDLITPTSTAVGINTALQVIAQGGPLINTANAVLLSNDGAVTLAGSAISQLGAIEATTSVTRPGSIGLTAGGDGNIVLGRDSLTAILPDENGGTLPTSTVNSMTSADAPYFQAVLQPQISVQAGGSVDIQGNGAGLGGALIKAPSAALTIAAGSGAGSVAGSTGTVLLEPGSTIDLSGIAGVTLPMSVNEVSVLITAAEVADDPLAKSLIGKTLTIDARVGSPILDVSGYIGLIPETIDQILTAGGSFTSSAENFIQQPGAVINVSAGYVQYLGGMINTTHLLGTDGRIYDIGSANPNIGYVGIAGQFTVDHPRWGVTETYTASLVGGGYYEPGYIAGASAGTISVTAQVPIVAGDIVADIVAGGRQRALAGSSNLAPSDQMPTGASLSITFANQPSDFINTNNAVLESQANAAPDPYGLSTLTAANWSTWTPTLATPTGAASPVFPVFSDLLNSFGLNAISITGANELSMPKGQSLAVLPGGSITLGGVTAIDGTLTAPAGKISLTGFTYASGSPQVPPTPAVVIGPDAVLDVSGLWVNDVGLLPSQMQGAAFIGGGSVSITTIAASNGPGGGDGLFTDVTQSIVLAPGSVIDVSGGGYVGTTGKLKTGSDRLPDGKGGSLTLTTYAVGWSASVAPQGFENAYNVFPHDGVDPNGVSDPNQANVLLGGTIYAYGFDGGGTFSLQAPTITIDGTTAAVTSYFSSAAVNGSSANGTQTTGLAAASGLPVSTFPTSDRLAGTVVLPPAFFTTAGFSQYTLTSTYGSTTVTAGTQVLLRQPSFVMPGNETQMPTGARVRSFAPVGVLPDGVRKPVSLTLVEDAFSQAAGTDPASTAGILIDNGASIVADPLATVSLVAGGPVTLLGSIIAPGGTINLFNNPTLTTNQQGTSAGTSRATADVWIGPDAVLDVGGVFVPNPLALGYSTGTVYGGGTITIYGDVIVQPTAQFDLQGSQVTAASDLIQARSGSLLGPSLGQTEWSNGGNLQLAGNIYFAPSAGTIDAAGGAPQAAGGTLAIGDIAVPAALSSYVSSAIVSNGTLLSPNAIVVVPAGTVAANLPASASSSYPVTPAELTSMAPSTPGTFIGADVLSNSGFDSVTLNAGRTIAFAGSVTVSVPGALTLTAGAGNFTLMKASSALVNPLTYQPAPCTTASCVFPNTINSATVSLDAGYVQMVGLEGNGNSSFAAPKVADGTLNVSAQWIDLERAIALDDVGNANFTSAGAVRLLPDNYGFVAGGGSIVPNPATGGVGSITQTTFGGALLAPGNLTLTAAEIYPVSNTQFLLMSTGTLASDSTLTIRPNGAATAPLSVGGMIVLDAQTIVQNGTLWAPLGSIVLGLQTASQIPDMVQLVLSNGYTYAGPFAVTQNLTLGTGSLTSVSAAGLDIPDGYTIDGTTWYQGTRNNSNLTTVLAAAPAKSISLFGGSITTQANAVIDLSGGGDLYATEFVAGTGGTRNVLTTYEQNLVTGAFTPQYADGRQVYALVPSYQAKVAAYDPGFADFPYYSGLVLPAISSANNAPYNNALTPGMSVTLAGGGGIPAGTYTLLPGMYATLPGAYRVVQVASNVNPATTKSITSVDGSQYVVGTLANSLTGAYASQPMLFQLQSNAVWTKYSQINITSGTTFFRNQAIAAGNAVPPLPIDGGVLVFGATSSLNLAGTNLFAPGTSDLAPGLQGAGGQVQISAADILILAAGQPEPGADCAIGGGPTCTAPANSPNYLVLDADEISNLGAASVLIGGTAVFGSSGETIAANAQNIEVDTDAAHPLSGPELILASTAGGNGITVDAGSVIRAVGTVPQGTSRNITVGHVNGGTSDPLPTTSGDGSLLRVSNGTAVTVTRANLPANPAGTIAIGTGPGSAGVVAGAQVTIAGTNLTVDSSGNSVFAPDITNPDGSVRTPGVTLLAQNYDLAANLINFGTPTSPVGGLTLSQNALANFFANASTVELRSASYFNLWDNVPNGLAIGSAGIGTLTLSGSGLYHAGGNTTITAQNVVLSDSEVNASATGMLTGAGGTLAIDATAGTLSVNVGTPTSTANTLTMYLGGTGSGTTGNFGSFNRINLNAAQAIVFAGTGSASTVTNGTGTAAVTSTTVNNSGVLNAGSAAVSLSAPAVVANAASAQSLTTTGQLTITTGAGTAPSEASDVGNLGGALALTGGSILDSGSLVARSGTVSLTATTGNIELQNGASIDARGALVTVLDQSEYAPGGSVQLTANAGNILIDPGATVAVSAIGLGRAGSLTITATGEVSLNGSLQGSAGSVTDASGNVIVPAFKDMGGSFTLNAGSLGAGSQLPTSFTGSIAVTLHQGNIVIGTDADAIAPALNAGQITLTANTGSVVISGSGDATNPNNRSTILDASGLSGQIALYGAAGVTIDSGVKVTAAYVADDPRDPNYGNGTSLLAQNGGTVTLGTTGTPDGSPNATYGYENVDSSGTIMVAAGTTFDVSGGPGGANIANTGGQVVIRAPILTSNNVNVSFAGTVRTNAQLDANGNVVTDGSGNPVASGNGVVLDAYAVWSTTDNSTSLTKHFDGMIDPAGWFTPSTTATGGFTFIGGTVTSTGANTGLFTPNSTGVNLNHVTFYQQTLVGFVQAPFNSAAVAGDFTGAELQVSGAAPIALPSSSLQLRPEIDLVNPNGNITVGDNWNLGATCSATVACAASNAPLYRTSAGEPGMLALRAANNIQIGGVALQSSSGTVQTSMVNTSGGAAPTGFTALNIDATISDGFVETSDAFGGSTLIADKIADNPGASGSKTDLNTTSAASLMSTGAGNLGSFSYDFVAGAANVGSVVAGSLAAPSANPNAAIPVASLSPSLTANVTINGHTVYNNPFTTALGKVIDIPTLVRTGTGSITMAAAGNVELLDQLAPGAVYTAGAVAAPISGFLPPTIPSAYNTTPNGLLSTPSWAIGGGSVTVTAGQSIIGIETPTNSSSNNQTGVTNGPTGQFWSPWYIHYGQSDGQGVPFAACAASGSVACQTAAWVNYATFFQGFGALGGGNIALTAGVDIDDVGASLPETVAVSGGLTSSQVQANYFGGGNLVVTAGRNLNSNDFLVGRGTGLIEAGGAVQVDGLNPITNLATGVPQVTSTTAGAKVFLPLLLSVQDGFITVAGRGSVTLGNVYDPASVPVDLSLWTPLADLPGVSNLNNRNWSNLFTSYGPDSGIALSSVTGNVTTLTVSSSSNATGTVQGMFVHTGSSSLLINNNSVGKTSIGLLLPATLDLVALSGNISVNSGNVGDINLLPYPSSSGNDTGTIDLVADQSINLGGGLTMPDLATLPAQYFGSNQRGAGYTNYLSPLGVPYANLTLALHANDPAPVVIAAGQNISASATLTLLKPAEIEAGGSVSNLSFVGENNNPSDITSIVAGNNLVGGSYVLYGPGTLLLQAGHDMGPFTPSQQSPNSWWGIATIGDGSGVATTFGNSSSGPLKVRSYLPTQGADIDVLFGVAPGINYAAAIAQYVDPAAAGTGGIDFLADIAAILGQSPDQAWVTFEGLSAARQHLLVDRAFLDFITRVGQDYNNPSSPYHLQYNRAYQAIATLFPASFGYTDNAGGGGANGAAATVSTGNLNVAASVLETQMGGDINILGPGGTITAGHSSTDPLNPSQEGILTLAGGTIRAYTDSSVLLNQSRIMTEQGGDIDLFSANGDISAGEGPKTYVSDPPISLICDINGYCFANPQGLVTGAGIGALVTLPGQDPTKSNVNLAAPHGTIDAGSAGIRVAGNLSLLATTITNAFNIQVQGTVTGLQTAAAPNVGALTSASNAAGQTAATAMNAANQGRNRPALQDLPSIITVEVVGYGGGDNGAPSRNGGSEDRERNKDRKKSGDQGLNERVSPYSTRSAVQVLGSGALTSEERQYLTEAEKQRLLPP